MTRSSRHKSHKHSKHSSRDYSDSEEEVVKTEKRSKDENSSKSHRDSASGEKRKGSSHTREGKDRDLIGHGNGEAVEEYVSSKRRKEKADVLVGDRWCAGVDGRGDDGNYAEKGRRKGESVRGEGKLKEYNNKSEEVEIDWSNKSKRYDGGISGERRDDGLASMMAGKEEGKGRGESKRKLERDSSTRRDARELKEKDYRSDKEKNGDWESKGGDTESKLIDMEVGKKQAGQVGDSSKERQGKRSRDHTDLSLEDELRHPELAKEVDKKIRRKRECSTEREKHYVDLKEGDERRLSSRGDRAKDIKHRDNKHKDPSYEDKYQGDGYKDEKRRDEKYKDGADKDNKYLDDKYREDGEKDVRRRGDRHRQEGERDNRRKDEKHREDRERDSMRKDDKYWEGTEKGGRRDDKYYEDGERETRHKDGRYVDKDIRRGDESYLVDENTDDRHKDMNYKDDGNRNNRHKEEKYRKDVERDIRHKDSNQGDGHDKEKRLRDTKYRDELSSRDRSGNRSDLKRARDDDYATDHYSRKSNAYDDSPTHDDRTARSRDDQRRRRVDEKEDAGDIRSQPTKDRRSDIEKRSGGSEKLDPAADRVRSASRTADIDLTSSHSRRRSSPTSSALAPRDDYRAVKQDESKYRDYNYDDRSRHNASSRDYAGAVGGSDKTSSRPSEKHGQEDGHPQELSAERHTKSDIHASPLEHVDKSPSSNTDRRQFSRSDVRRGTDIEESSQRSGGSRDQKEYSVKEGKGGRELPVDVLPGEEPVQVDAETVSISSPYMRNSQFTSSSKLLPPPPIRSGVDSPSPLGSADDEGRGRFNNRLRRMGDPTMGRIQGNSWRGAPSWPSPAVSNGFLPFPPPVGFHSVMHPFPAPPMFGVRPSMDLDHPSPYHMPDADRYSGSGYSMGWRPQMDNSGRPLHSWDASNAVFGEGSNFYGRSDWDPSGNVPGGRGWEMGEDLLRGPNRTGSMEMSYSNKENASTQSGDEALAGQSLQVARNEQTQTDQQGESADLSHSAKSFEKNEVEHPLISLEDSSDTTKMSRKDYMRLCHVYISKLDISADLADPELLNECMGLIDVDESIFSDVDDSKILYVGDEEAKMASHKLLSCTLFASNDDSVFQKSMSLYEKQKMNFRAHDDNTLNSLDECSPSADQEDPKVEDLKTVEQHPMDEDVQAEGDIVPNSDAINVDSNFGLLKGDAAVISNEPVSSLDSILQNSEYNQEQQDLDVGEKPSFAGIIEESDAPLLSNTNHPLMSLACKDEEVKLLEDTKCGSMLSSDMPSEASSEAIMSESVVSGSVNLSRIHHSPENTH